MARLIQTLAILSMLAFPVVMGANVGALQLPVDAHLLMSWYCGCSGACKYDTASRGATGYGDNIGIATSDCQTKLADTCQASGGLDPDTYVGDKCSETTT